MGMMDYSLLFDLEQSDQNPCICVRVSRLWEFYDQNDETTVLHLGLVLVDEEGTSIAAQIYPPCDKIFKPILTEGKVYYLHYYRVRNCTKRYKPVSYNINAILNVALWGERATSFPAEEGNHEPIKWIDLPPAAAIRANVDLNPFVFKKHEFQIVIKKIDMEYSCWYKACDVCKLTAKAYGNAYKCGNPTCPPVVSASSRFKLNAIAGDETADTKFVLFGCIAQRLIGRSDDDNPPLSQKFVDPTTKHSTSKSYKKRARPSPGTGAAKKLFKDNGDDAAGDSGDNKA
ncbi:hypothetical protein E2562_011744 [Oryza meyeriana var. granulata]|uniref:Replication protein A 70 kDa DNA-binding subunit B/D first OB fold domain-containing protein n=1 Tax=Oryza meyeriana var. granulata TaxID=110450 RepID=A0A6G1DGK9_9ORYZ|nr:hypothetical protein E2562_011744 [Oryza meyeriana var. granulata]